MTALFFFLALLTGRCWWDLSCCVGDGEHVLLVQDLIVREEYRRQGIGHALFRTVWDKWCSVRMFQANTDASDPTANRFYRSFGMKKLEEGGMTGYYR